MIFKIALLILMIVLLIGNLQGRLLHVGFWGFFAIVWVAILIYGRFAKWKYERLGE